MQKKDSEKYHRTILKGSWFKYKTITLSYEFLKFLEDDNLLIDEVVTSKHLKIKREYCAEDIEGEDDEAETEWD
jgi:hypothetical protein